MRLADGQGARLVSRPHGIRTARAGSRSILADPRSPTMQNDAQSEGQVSRDLSGRSRPRCCARMWPTGSSWTPTARTCCSSPMSCKARRRPMTARRASSIRHRQAERPALRYPGSHPRGLFGAHSDRASRDQSALSCAADRRSRNAPAVRCCEHQLQRARRADRLHAGRCLSLLHGHRIDLLAIGNCILRKEQQQATEADANYPSAFETD